YEPYWQLTPFDLTVLLQSLDGIGRTSRIKPAARPVKGRYEQLVKPDKGYETPFHVSSLLFQYPGMPE
uniref:hypothetical protein n=1 Tax=Megasphaera sp. TaxID=2023260 RepID=UPI00402832A1